MNKLIKNQGLLAALMLIFITPFLTELISSNLPAHVFFRPNIFLFLIIVYGFVVLSIRELALKWNLGILGIFALGIAYGIYNEGICAKTLLMKVNVPVNTYDGYSFLGLNIPWALFILTWHALHSVLFPILIVNYFLSNCRQVQWIGSTARKIIFGIFSLLGVLMFFNVGPIKASVVYLFVFLFFIALIVFLSNKTSKMPKLERSQEKIKGHPAIFGYFFYLVFFAGFAAMGASKINEALFFVLFAAALFFVYKIVKNKGWLNIEGLTFFALGDYAAVALFAGVTGIQKQAPEVVVTGFLLFVFFLVLILILRRDRRR